MNESFFLAGNSNTYVIINNGARVLQEKYLPFALYLSRNSINVITYDYTDMGLSVDKMINSQTSIQQWVTQDMDGAIATILKKNIKAQIYVIGHSLGGQIIGLSKKHKNIKGIILVATQTGNHRYWNFPLNLLNIIFWRYYVPRIIKYRGYFPSGNDSGMDNMPKVPALEWAQWCQSENYLFDNIPQSERYYEQITCPLLSISFNDDIYATKKSVDWFTAKYPHAQTKRVHYKSVIKKYGHSALFEADNFSTLGMDVINFIKGRA
jgi:predicted alpha/beta hydrolase